jgi:hypothetical protein
MITIEYLDEMVCGEPGPNLYWMGKPHDYLLLINDIHCLGVENGIEICLNDLDYINVLEDFKIFVKSKDEGNILCQVDGKVVTIELSILLWQQILSLFLGITFGNYHNYIDCDVLEFDGLEFVEQANFIISSEF